MIERALDIVFPLRSTNVVTKNIILSLNNLFLNVFDEKARNTSAFVLQFSNVNSVNDAGSFENFGGRSHSKSLFSVFPCAWLWFIFLDFKTKFSHQFCGVSDESIGFCEGRESISVFTAFLRWEKTISTVHSGKLSRKSIPKFFKFGVESSNDKYFFSSSAGFVLITFFIFQTKVLF